MDSIQKFQKPVYRILFFGETGAGKSFLINKIAGKILATEYATQKSGTSKADVHKYETDDSIYELIDTIGFEDNTGKSKSKIINDILLVLQKCRGGFHLCVYCQSATDPRMRTNILKDFAVIFGTGMYQHLVITRTKLDQLDLEHRECYIEQAKEDIFNLLNEDPDFSEIQKERILFSDPSEQESFRKHFLDNIISLVKTTPIYTHSLSEINFEKLEDHRKCLKITEFINLIEINISDLKKSIMTTKKSLEDLEKKDMNKKNNKDKETHLLKVEKAKIRLQEYEEELKIFNNLEKNNQFFIEFTVNSKSQAEIYEYLFERGEVSLLDDIISILEAWNESKTEIFRLRTSFEGALINEIKTKIPPVIEKRIRDILQRQLQGIISDIKFQLETENDKIQFFTGVFISATSLSVLTDIIGSIGFYSAAEIVGTVTLGTVGLILGGLYIKKKIDNQINWDQDEVIRTVAYDFQTQIAKQTFVTLCQQVRKNVKNVLKDFSQMITAKKS